jgi:uncharacterized protein (TIGR01741 family)
MGLFDRFKKKETVETKGVSEPQTKKEPAKEPGVDVSTPRMNSLYSELARKIAGMMPDEWTKIYLYAEILSDSRTLYFFFQRASDNEIIHFLRIPDRYKVNERIFDRMHHEAIEIAVQLHDEFKANYEKVWTNFTFVLENTGKFSIKFNYTDVNNSGFNITEMQKIWMYEVMGMEPKDEKGKDMLQRYLDSDRFFKM